MNTTAARRRSRSARTLLVIAAQVAAVVTCLLPATAEAASTTQREWFFIPRGAHTRPAVPPDVAALLEQYAGVWLGPPKVKTVYLTFDAAAELGTTARLVRVLAAAEVTASFFLTGQYMHDNPKLTRRIARHGHLICNHSYAHPNMARLATSRSAFARQLSRTASAYHNATGGTLSRVFRFPSGIYSARALSLVEQLGYTSVFWSFAHYDYNEYDQPPVSVTRRRLVNAAAPGVVYLLHAGSKSDTDALASVIRALKRRGYSFATVDQLAQ